MNFDKLVQSLHPLERKVLPVLDKHTTVPAICAATGLKDVEVGRALQWLENKKIIRVDISSADLVTLDKNGELYKKQGLPERRFLHALGDKELTVDKVADKAKLSRDELNICLGLLRKKALVHISHDKGLRVKLTEQGKAALKKEFIEESFLRKDFPIHLSALSSDEKAAVQSLRPRRAIIRVEQQKTRSVALLPLGRQLIELGVRDEKIIDAITPQVILSGEWKKKPIRRYDVAVQVPKISGGRRHFVSDSINKIKKIWRDMGFNEMTGTIVQSAFWNMDALYIPQDHPAREMQDTFFLKKPNKGMIPKEFVSEIKAVHEYGGKTGSTGWQQPWSEEKAKELLLRTHSTVLSAQAISRLTEADLPAKFFSVVKVFRNETLDWKHLFEFCQVEGIVVDPDANLCNLQGYLKEFFRKMGFEKIRIRPSHFPYTEPSMEVDVWHPVKNEWVELGGTGIFRPEVVQPLLGKAVPVLAWGLGMERIITDYYKITDLRDIYKNDVQQLREARLQVK
ncbi:MAG: phenylalanine--tRNA ligase subunit alpha [Candidatus Woesearchaeota archaeon]